MQPIVKHHIEQRTLGNKLAVVVGTGKSGLAAARLLAALGARVRVVDRNEQITEAHLGELAGKVELVTGPHETAHFDGADLVILSPGVPVKKLESMLGNVPAANIMAELEFASRYIEAPTVAITGTNGKTTTTTLISEIFKADGRTVFTGGNIGTPLCDYLLDMDPADVIVLEVSSFQLQNCASFHPQIGLFLNFSANHLDYHESMEEYLDAKLSLFEHMDEDDAAILHESLHPLLDGREFTTAQTVWYGPTDRFEAPHLPGAHNRANVEAAWQVVSRLGVSQTTAAEAIQNFRPLAHRIEPVAEINGVLYVDDSKATTLDAVSAAVHSFDRPVRLLMGGVWKGGDVERFAAEIKGRVVHVGLFGGSRDILEPTLSEHFPVTWDETLPQAVNRQAAQATSGDVVLLSPATSSFDQYANYGERGADFQNAVGGLK